MRPWVAHGQGDGTRILAETAFGPDAWWGAGAEIVRASGSWG